MDIGLQVADECIQEYNALKMSQKWRYILYKIEGNKNILIEKKGNRDETYQDFLKSLPQSEARYVVFDYHFKTDEGRIIDKIIYIFWCPDNSSVKVRMVSASNNQFFSSKLQGFALAIQAKDLSDLDQKDIENKLAH